MHVNFENIITTGVSQWNTSVCISRGGLDSNSQPGRDNNIISMMLSSFVGMININKLVFQGYSVREEAK